MLLQRSATFLILLLTQGKLLRIFLTVFLFLSHTAFSQSYSTGYKKYVKGDFAGAENAFKIALNKNQSDAEKARLYKMIGISQYMQGKRIAAESSFQQAKTMNPYINISASEVLDDSIIPFFNTVRPAAPKNNRRPAPVESVTTLKIYANVPRATVTVDGVRLGIIGKPLKVSPGIHEVTVGAPGYQPVSQPIDIKAGETNNLSITLKKAVAAPPKEVKKQEVDPPKPVPAPKKVTEAPESKTKKERIKKSRKKSKISKSQSGKKVSKKKRKRRKKSSKSKPSPVVYLMPFGVPQYMNDRTGLGIVFSTVQAGGLIYGIIQYLASEKLVTETNAEITRLDEERAKITDLAQQQADQEKAVAYQEEQQAKIDKLFIQYWIGFGTFGAAWAASTIKAFISGPKKKSRRSSGLPNSPGWDPQKKLLAKPDLYPDRYYPTEWDLQLVPMRRPLSPQKKNGYDATLGLNLYIKF